MQESLHQPLAALRLSNAFAEPTFQLFIACADQAALLEAKELQAQLGELCGDQVEISRIYWNFALLRHEELRAYATREAAGAEMVVVALGRGNELPDHVKSWLEGLPSQTPTGHTALVALMSADGEAGSRQEAIIDYLQRTATSRGMDFFCNRDTWESLTESPRPAPVLDSVRRLCQPLLTFHMPWSSGGIND